jgi:predicted nucleic acid-binding protein
VSDIVFIDTNVLLDVLLAREPFLAHAQRIWTLSERKMIHGVVSAASFLNIYYIVRRLASRREAERAIHGMQAVFQIAAVDGDAIDVAMKTRSADFEDAVQLACAIRAKAVCIITRDERHFAGSALPVMAPDMFLAKLG